MTQLSKSTTDRATMLRHPLVAAGLLLVVGTSGCASPSVASPPEESHRHPAWLTGVLTDRYYVPTTEEHQTHHIQLEPDGRAIETWSVSYRGVPGMPMTRSREYGSWSFENDALLLMGLSYTVRVAANCHLVQLDDRVFDRDDNPITGCPTTEAPLTEHEAAFTGGWASYLDDDADVFMHFDSHRELSVRLDLGLKPLQTTFAIDENGALGAWTLDGVKVLEANVTLTRTGRLRWCEGEDCTMLRAVNPSSR